MQQKAAVVIIHFGNADLTIKAIQSCLNQTWIEIAVIVINNGLDKDQKLLEQTYSHAKNVKIVDAYYNTGFAEANNAGAQIALSDGDVGYILLLNNDAELKENALEKLIESVTLKNADIGVPRILKTNGETESIGLKINRFYHPFNRLGGESELFSPMGACFLITASALKKLGKLFREEFFAYAEDYELGYRIKKMGLKMVECLDAEVVHQGQSATSYLSDFSVYHTYRNLIWAFRIHMPWRKYILALFGLAPFILLHIFRGRFIVIKGVINGFLKKQSEI